MRRLCAICGCRCFTALLNTQGQPPVMMSGSMPAPTESTTKSSAAARYQPVERQPTGARVAVAPDEQRLADGTRPGDLQATPPHDRRRAVIEHVVRTRVVALNAETGACDRRSMQGLPGRPGNGLAYQPSRGRLLAGRQRVRILHEQPRPVVLGRHEDGPVDHRVWPERLRDAEGGAEKPRRTAVEMRQTSPPVVFRNMW